jgi:hypothetical protein
MLALLLLAPFAFAQDPGADMFEPLSLVEPLPLHGSAWDLEVHSYVLPPQDVSWLESTDAFRSCVIRGSMAPGGVASFELVSCPDAMGPVALEATQRWAIQPAPDAEPEGTTVFEVHYVVRYSETLATMTTHATIDPGTAAAFDGYAGVPGVKLVHGAGLVKLKQPKLPKASKKAGITPPVCQLRVAVDPVGSAGVIDVVECPEGLGASAVKAARKARYTPRVVDGMTESETITVPVPFR